MLNNIKLLLHKKNKFSVFFIVFLGIIISLVETLSFAAIIPFISFAGNPSSILKYDISSFIFKILNYDSLHTFVIHIGFTLIGFYTLRLFIILLYNKMLNSFAAEKNIEFSYKLLRKYIYLQYREFTQKNKSVLIKRIINESQLASNLLVSFLILFTEIILLIFLFIMLLYTSFYVTIVLSIALFTIYYLFNLKLSKRFKLHGEQRYKHLDNSYIIISKILDNFKYIKIRCIESLLLKKYDITCRGYCLTIRNIEFFKTIPKIVLESCALISIIVSTIVIITMYSDYEILLFKLGLYFTVLYRLLPSLNKIYHSINTISSLRNSAEKILMESKNFNIPIDSVAVSFKKSLKLVNCSFSHGIKTLTLNNVNLEIYKGDFVGLVGPSGGGKSTLLDVIMGLQTPSKGQLFVDSMQICDNNVRSWMKKIGYVPQNISLFQGTVSENILFENSDNNEDKLNLVLKKVELYDFLYSKKEGLQTLVGDSGVMLSGGQIQRLGIARALYNDPDVLILDEPTSALDVATETKIINLLNNISKDITILIVTHRESTLKFCNRIINVKDGLIYEGELC